MATVFLVAAWAGPAPAAPVEVGLKVVGRSDLGSTGTYGDVTVVGTTAVVATEAPATASSPCPLSALVVVDLKDARRPQTVAPVPLPAGMTAATLDSLAMDTPAFRGDLLGIALVRRPGAAGACGGPERVAWYDVTDAGHPRPVAETAGVSSVSLAARRDGRVVAVASEAGGVRVLEVTDPAHPATLGRWRDPAPAGAGACTPTARLDEDGLAAVFVRGDGGVYELDLADAANPSAAGPTRGDSPPANAGAAVLTLGNRTLALVSQSDCRPAPTNPGRLRVLTVAAGVAPVEDDPVQYPGPGGPGRIVASGALAYVAWQGAGLRVIDFGEVRPRTVAAFSPGGADVVGVGLLPDHVVVTDANLGLYVLERPAEGGGRAGFWSQFLGVAPYLGFPLVALAFALLPRFAARRTPAAAPAPAPTPARVRRRSGG